MTKRRGKSKSQRRKSKEQRKMVLSRAATLSPHTDGQGSHLSSAAAQAQELVYEAYDEDLPESRIAKAEAALALWPDCADAYLLLADHKKTAREAVPLLEQALEAGERAIGKNAFQECHGQFWGFHETRPYMRARETLAHALWQVGRRDEAMGHLEEMLDLNPKDNQGVRSLLVSWYFVEEYEDGVADLLESYQGDFLIYFPFSAALLSFRTEGDTADARDLLDLAIARNEHVARYMIDSDELPIGSLGDIKLRSPEEAIDYLQDHLVCWTGTPGAVEWVKKAVCGDSHVSDSPERASDSTEEFNPEDFMEVGPPVGPLPIVLERLRKLPQCSDVIQIGLVPMPELMDESTLEVVRLTVVLAYSTTQEQVYPPRLIRGEVTSDHVWDVLAKIMEEPIGEEPARPTAIQLCKVPFTKDLIGSLSEIGVSAEHFDELEPFDSLVRDFGMTVEAVINSRGLIEEEGVTPQMLGRFYDKAADFYDSKPWESVPTDAVIRMELPQMKGGPWFATIMGQTGIMEGVQFLEDLSQLRRCFDDDFDQHAFNNEVDVSSVTYGSEDEVLESDLEAIEDYNWPIAGPTSYPRIICKEAGQPPRNPTPEELEIFTVAMQAIWQFIDEDLNGPEETFTTTVSLGRKRRKVILSWVED